MSHVILFRKTLAEADELTTAAAHFPIITQRAYVQPGDLVIGRYSTLPYHDELERDVVRLGGQLINTYPQHCYIADLEQWYHDLEGLTPRTWFNGPAELPAMGRFVLKGRTNSRKDRWRTMMLAQDRCGAIQTYSRLMDDPLIAPQGVVIREYVPLEAFDVESVSGIPISKEYRFFILDGKVLAGGFYWSTHVEELQELEADYNADMPGAQRFLEEQVVPRILAPPEGPRFYVVDVAVRRDGGYIVIELNDGTMSGLGEVNADALYRNLAEALRRSLPETEVGL